MKHKNFYMVPNSIFELELKPRELAVYCCLLKNCNEDMTCYPSHSTIGKDCCVDKSTVDILSVKRPYIVFIRKITLLRLTC